MRALSEEDARRIGAELKRLSEKPVRTTNMQALGLCAVAMVMTFLAARTAPDPASVVHGIATMFVVVLGSVHFMASGLLRGMLRAGIGEARHAIDAMKDPRRISNFDMAMFWLVVALAIGQFG